MAPRSGLDSWTATPCSDRSPQGSMLAHDLTVEAHATIAPGGVISGSMAIHPQANPTSPPE